MSLSEDDLSHLNYCRIHCQTERALFRGDHINRTLELAFPSLARFDKVRHQGMIYSKVDPYLWFSVHEEMETLCDIALERDRLDREFDKHTEGIIQGAVDSVLAERGITPRNSEEPIHRGQTAKVIQFPLRPLKG